MDHSPLRKVSLELREHIYENVFEDLLTVKNELMLLPKSFLIRPTLSEWQNTRPRPTRLQLHNLYESSRRNPHALAASATCRELRAEFLNRLFSSSVICVRLDYTYVSTDEECLALEADSIRQEDCLSLQRSWIETTGSVNTIRRLRLIIEYGLDEYPFEGATSGFSLWWLDQVKQVTKLIPPLPHLQEPISSEFRSTLVPLHKLRRCVKHGASPPLDAKTFQFIVPLDDRARASQALKEQRDKLNASLVDGAWSCGRGCSVYWAFVYEVSFLGDLLQERLDEDEESEEEDEIEWESENEGEGS